MASLTTATTTVIHVASTKVFGQGCLRSRTSFCGSYAYNAETGIYVEESVDAIKRRLSDRLLEASRQTNCP
jgi:hypothetical protein